MKSASLRKFWDRFEARTLGGTQPAVLDTSDFAEPLFSPEDGIALVDSMFAKEDLSVNIGGRLCDSPQLLPPPSTAAAYPEFVDRLAAANDTDTITFTRDYCLKYSPSLAHRVRSFVHKYIRTRGLPFPGVNVVFIGGRYQATWIGLHNDYCDTFLVPAIGPKHMLLWPPPYFQDTPLIRQPSLNGICYGHINLSPYRSDALTLDVSPGQLLYIPQNWWHYNDLPSANLTMGLSIGVFNNASIGNIVNRAMSAALELSEPDKPQQSMPFVPAGTLSGDLTEVQVDPQADRIIQRAGHFLRLQSLLASSCSGVLGCQPYRELPLDLAAMRLRGNEESPVYLIVESEPCLLVAGGALHTVVDQPALRWLVESVNSLKPFSLTETVCSQNDETNNLHRIIAWLYGLGCIDILVESS